MFYLFLRQSMSGEGQRERETQIPKQASGSELSVTNWATQVPPKMFLFLRERERERTNVSRGEAEREGDTDLKQTPGSEL